MSGKKESTYAALIDMLKTKFPDWCPTIFHADFEITVANALRIFVFTYIDYKVLPSLLLELMTESEINWFVQ